MIVIWYQSDISIVILRYLYGPQGNRSGREGDRSRSPIGLALDAYRQRIREKQSEQQRLIKLRNQSQSGATHTGTLTTYHLMIYFVVHSEIFLVFYHAPFISLSLSPSLYLTHSYSISAQYHLHRTVYL